jgi:hypothetical protein
VTYKEHRFCNALIRRLYNGSDVDERTLTLAALESFGFAYMSDEKAEAAALRRAKRLMRREDIRLRFQGLFENGGLLVTDAIRMHIKHIADGNYAALKDYWAMTQGPIQRQVIVKGAVAHVDLTGGVDREPKPIQARSLTGKTLVLDGLTGEVREATVLSPVDKSGDSTDAQEGQERQEPDE